MDSFKGIRIYWCSMPNIAFHNIYHAVKFPSKMMWLHKVHPMVNGILVQSRLPLLAIQFSMVDELLAVPVKDLLSLPKEYPNSGISMHDTRWLHTMRSQQLDYSSFLFKYSTSSRMLRRLILLPKLNQVAFSTSLNFLSPNLQFCTPRNQIWESLTNTIH